MSLRFLQKYPLRSLLSLREPLKTQTAKRTLFARAFLKLGEFENRTFELEKRLELIKDKFMTQVISLLQNEGGVVFRGDLNLMVHISKTEEEKQVLEKFLMAYVAQYEGDVTKGVAVGTSVMRMCHVQNDYELACRLVQNQTLIEKGMFSMSSKIILGDMLFEEGMYDRLDALLDTWPELGTSNAVAYLAYATYMKQNTKQSLEKAIQLSKKTRSKGVFTTGPFIAALLALRQNEPSAAYDILSQYPSRDNTQLVRKLIWIWVLAETGRMDSLLEQLEFLMSRLSSPAETPIFMRLLKNSLTLDLHVMEKVKECVSRQEDTEKKQLCLSTLQKIESSVILVPGSLETALFQRVNAFVPRERNRVAQREDTDPDSDLDMDRHQDSQDSHSEAL